jgi:K+/H+ antiporter YhaU regulatory subunit KhtT
VEFLELSAPDDGADINLEEVVLSDASSLVGTLLRDLPSLGLHAAVVAIKRGDEQLQINPGPEAMFQAGDRVIVVGDEQDLAHLGDLATPTV